VSKSNVLDRGGEEGSEHLSQQPKRDKPYPESSRKKTLDIASASDQTRLDERKKKKNYEAGSAISEGEEEIHPFIKRVEVAIHYTRKG